MINDVEWLQERHDWPGLKAVVMVESRISLCSFSTVRVGQSKWFLIIHIPQLVLAGVFGPDHA
jgi:hypothetical protein